MTDTPKRAHRGARPRKARSEYALLRVTAAAHDRAVELANETGRTLTDVASSVLMADDLRFLLDSDR